MASRQDKVDTVKSLIKRIGRFVLLSAKTAKSCLYILMHAKYQPIERTEEGRLLLVCGNGPSLGRQIELFLDVFQKHDVLCVNSFCTTEYFHQVKPRYYAFMCPDVAHDPGDETDFVRDRIEAQWAGLDSVDWEMELIVPHYFVRFPYFEKRIKKLNACIRVRYINLLTFEGFMSIRNWSLKKQLSSIGGQNTVTAAVFYGICKGYGEIYLLGTELDWFKSITVDEENNLYHDDTHFYGTTGRLPLSEFGGRITLSEYLGSNVRTFQEFERLREYAENGGGTTIYNATPNSMVDAFERRRLETLVDKS